MQAPSFELHAETQMEAHWSSGQVPALRRLAIKRLLDRVLAILLIALVSPLLVVIALAVRLDSTGPAIFRQTRYGKDRRTFQILKFRTMRTADDTVFNQAVRGDARLTRVGRILRRTSLDEIPQLFNVLWGDMSLVGPRPHAVAHDDHFAPRIDRFGDRYRVAPGMTGLAQISGLRGETDTIEKMRARIQMDNAYIDNWSVWSDLRIIVLTPLGIMHTNAY